MGAELDIRRRRYPVIGRSWPQLEAAMAVAGPTRGGITYPAYTDWTLTYRYRPEGAPPRVVARDVEIRATAIITLPEWHGARGTDEALLARWSRFLIALEKHERAHASTARAAAVTLERAVEALAPCPDEATLDAKVYALVTATRAGAHRRDEEIDDGHSAVTG